MANLAESLRMDHLEPPSTEELVARVSAKTAPAAVQASVAAPDPRDKEEWVFHLDWTDKRGKHWEGDFTNRILDFGELQQVAVLRSQFSGGQPLESLSEQMNLINTVLAHMTYSLKKRPDWAKDLRKLNSTDLIMALWEKVASHEATYFRLDAPEAESADQS